MVASPRHDLELSRAHAGSGGSGGVVTAAKSARWAGLLLAAALAVAAAAGIAGCGSDDEAGSPDPGEAGSGDAVLVFEIVDGEPVGGVQREAVSLGDSVTVEVSGDSDDQVHVHGYDLFVDLTDGEGTLTFDALIPGRFEIELEGSGRLIAELTVS